MSEPLRKTNLGDFLPENIFSDLVYSPLFAGAAAVSLSSLPAIPYNNVLVTTGIQNPTFSQIRISAKEIIQREGFWSFSRNNRGLMKCSSPALAGQFFYGACLFDCYESFKTKLLEQSSRSNSGKHRTKNSLGEIFFAALAAEFYSIFVLAPFEVAYAMMMMNVKDFPKTLGPVMKELASNPRQYRFPFGPVKPLIVSRLPQTAISFVLFEIFVAKFSASLVRKMHLEAKEKHDQLQQQHQRKTTSELLGDEKNKEIMAMTRNRTNKISSLNWSLPPPSRFSQLNISFSAGVASGVASRVILHPIMQYQLFSAKIENQFNMMINNSRTKDVIVEGATISSDPHFFRDLHFQLDFGGSRPTFGQKFSLWMKMQGSNPRLLWQGFMPRMWMSAFSGGVMWLTYDLVTGKNRVS